MEHDRQIAQPDFTSVMLVHILLDKVDRIRRMRLRRKCFRHTTSSRILKRTYGMQNRLFCGNPVKGGAADIALCRCVPIEIVHIQRSICRPGIDHADRLRTHAHTQRENPVTDLLRLRNRNIFLRPHKTALGQPQMHTDHIDTGTEHRLGLLLPCDKRHGKESQMMRQRKRLNLALVDIPILFECETELSIDQRNGWEVCHARKAARLNLLEILIEMNEGITRRKSE